MKKATVLLVLVLLLCACAPVPAVDVTPAKVFYAGEPGGVKTALDLAVQSGMVTLVDDISNAQTLVLNGQIPDGAAERVASGAGLVLILGEEITDAEAGALLGKPVSLLAANDAVSLTDTESASDSLLTEIIWNGAPQVRERFALSGLDTDWTPLVSAFENDEGFLYQLPENKFVITSWLSGGANPQIQEWGYFNYLIYHLASRTSGIAPAAFADYPASPIPHANDRNP